MRNPALNLRRAFPRGAGRLLAIALSWLVWLGFAASAHATDYTWTNTATGASGFWTNGNLWATPANYPGSNAASDNAYLTNNTGAGGSFTNILNRTLNFVVGTLAISNSTGGQSWLIVTNGALTNTTFTLGNGGALQIDSGGLLTNTTTFNWLGTNGTIYLNNGGKLSTAGGVTIGYNASSVTGLVTSLSSVGSGGLWSFNNQALIFSNNFNALTVNNVTLTNISSLTIGSVAGNFGNSLTLSNGANLFGGNVIVGTGGSSSNNSYNVGGLGAASYATNGTITVGNNGNNNFNSMTVSNATLLSGGSVIIGQVSFFNTVSVLSNATWNLLGNSLTLGQNIYSGGFNSSNNSLVINGGLVTNATITIGSAGAGNGCPWQTNQNNSLIITNGGRLFTSGAGSVGNAQSTPGLVVGNQMVVTGTGSLWNANGAGFTIGNNNTGAMMVSNNTLAISAGAVVTNVSLTVGVALNFPANGNGVSISSSGQLWTVGNNIIGAVGNGGANNTANVNFASITTGGRWDLGGKELVIGGNWNNGTASGNVLTVSSGGILNNGSLVVGGPQPGGGAGTDIGNQFILTGASTVTLASVTIGQGIVHAVSAGTAIGNSAIIGGAGDAPYLSNGLMTVGVSEAGGPANRLNTLTVTNATIYSYGLNIGVYGGNNSVTIQDGVPWSWNFGGGAIQIGSGTGITGDSNNVLTVGSTYALTNIGGIKFWNSNQTLVLSNQNLAPIISALSLGAPGEGGNTLTLTNQTVTNTLAASTIGNGSSNNILTILTNTLWNAGGFGITIGTGSATGNVLTVNGGIVSNVGAGAVAIGAAGTGNSNMLAIINGGKWFGGAVTLAGTGNLYQIGSAGAASIVTNGAITVGGYNTMNVTNATLLVGGTWAIGGGSQNAIVNVMTGATVNLFGKGLSFAGGGNSVGTSNNMMLINGGVVTNADLTYLDYVGNGQGGWVANNSLIISNGGQLFSANIGGQGLGYIGNVNADAVISNQIVVTGTGSVWNAGALGFTLAYNNQQPTAVVSNNSLRIEWGGLVTNLAGLTVGFEKVFGTSLIITNSGQLWTTGASYIGLSQAAGDSGVSNNAMVSAGGLWNLGGGSLYLGVVKLTTSAATGNFLVVSSGGIVTNVGALIVGDNSGFAGGTYGNFVVITNGGSLWSQSDSVVGNSGGGNGGTASVNSVTIMGNGALWDLAGKKLTIGYGNNGLASGNVVTVNNGILNSGSILVGAVAAGGSAVNNSLIVTTATINSGGLTIGANGTNNSVTVYGATPYLWNFGGGAITVGSGTGLSADTGNVFRVIGDTSGLTNIGGLSLYDANNSLALTNRNLRGLITGFNLGSPGEGGVSLTLSNQTITNTTSATSIGNGSSGNTLTVQAGTVWNNGLQNVIVGGTAGGLGASNNSLVIDGGGVSGGAIISNVASFVVGGNGLSASEQQPASRNSAIITNGGVLLSLNGMIGEPTVSYGANHNGFWSNSVVVTGSGSLWTNAGTIYVGGAPTLANGGNYFGSNNTLSILNSGRVFTASLNIGGDGSTLPGNAVTVNGTGSVLVVTNTIQLGYARATGSSNRLTIANGGTVIGSNVSVQAADIILVTDPGTVFTNSGFINLGNAPSSQPAGQFGAMTISNGARVFSASGSIGTLYWNSSSPPDSNTVIITGSGSQWIMPGSITIGGNSGPAPTNNSLTVAQGGLLLSSAGIIGGGTSIGGSNNFVLLTDSGSSWTNTGQITVGNYGKFSSLTISNKAVVVTSNMIVGAQAGTTGSVLSVNGATLIASNAPGTVGLVVGQSGSAGNSFLASAATNLVQGLTIGSGSSNNTVTVANGTFWNFLGGALTFGNGTGNILTVDSTSILTNIGGITMQDNGHSLYLTNATGSRNMILGPGFGTSGVFNIGATAGLGNDTLVLSNQTYTASGDTIVGNGSSNNLLSVLGNTTWDNGGWRIIVGTGAATGNVFSADGGGVVGGASVANVSTVIVGNTAGSIGNGVLLTNGAVLAASAGVIGNAANATNNFLTVSGGQLFITNAAGNAQLIVGGAGGGSNDINGSALEWANQLIIGQVAGGAGTVTANGGTLAVTNNSGTGFLNVGANGAGTLILGNGGSIIADTFRISTNTNTSGSGTFVWNTGGALKVGGSTDPSFIITNLFVGTTVSGYNPGYYPQPSGFMLFGSNSTAVLTINTNANINLSDHLTLGWGPGGHGYLNLNAGTFAVTNNGIGLTIGGGASLVTVSNGAKLFTGYTFIGTNWYFGGGPTSGMLITGPGSFWTNSGALNLGFNNGNNVSHGTLTVSGGATGYTATAILGNGTGGNQIFVTDTNSFLGVTGSGMTLGNRSPLIVSNAGKVVMSAGTITSPQYSGGAVSVLAGGQLVTLGAALSGGANPYNPVTYTVSGAGSAWTNTTRLTFGVTGANDSLIISNGALLWSGSLYTGGGADEGQSFYSYSNNVINVTGAGSQLVVTNELLVGISSGGGTYPRNSPYNGLIIENGGSAMALTGSVGSSVALGGSALTESNDYVVVRDANSRLLIGSGGWVVGDRGVLHSLTVSNSGLVAVAGDLLIGLQAGSLSNSVLVSGGSLLVTNATTSARLIIGGGGTASSATITNGGTLTADQIVIANSAGSSGTLFLQTNGVIVVNGASLIVGQGGGGTLVLNGGIFSNSWGINTLTNLILGQNVGSTGTFTTVGISFGVTNASQNAILMVGQNGLGTLTVTNGTLAADQLNVGGGVGGTGTVTIANLGVATVNNQLGIGTGAGSVGTVNVNSNGVLAVNNATVVIGQSGTGTLTINTGGTISNAFSGAVNTLDTMILGQNSGGTGWFNAAGVSVGITNATQTGSLIVGQSGAGNVTVTNGKLSADQLAIGGGVGGSGTLTINNRGVMQAGNMTPVLGVAAGSSGSLIINSNGVFAANASSFILGQSGSGTLTINGGAFSNAVLGSVNRLDSLILGQNSGGTGWFNVAGFNFGVINELGSGNLIVGQNGAGNVTVSNGTLTVDQLNLGAGVGGAGTLTLNNLGVINATNSTLALGAAAGSTGVLIVNSNGTMMVGNTATVIGQSGTGVLTLNGGLLTNVAAGTAGVFPNLILGQNSTGTGMFTVANFSFAVTNGDLSSQLVVGQAGYGSLTLSNGGRLFVNELLVTNNTATATNSIFSFVSGSTLTTSNALGAVAAYILNATPTNTVNGIWNMIGGSNILGNVSAFGNYVLVGNGVVGGAINLANGAVLNASNATLIVGNAANSSTLTNLNGTLLTAAANIGSSGDFNRMLVSGNSAVWSNSGMIMVGLDGSGNLLVISNGATAAAGSLWIAYSPGGGSRLSNRVDVVGSGTTLTLTNELVVGGRTRNAGINSNNILTIRDGAVVRSFSGAIGSSRGLAGEEDNQPGGLNFATVTGTNSAWLIGAGGLTVGRGMAPIQFGDGLTVSNGAQVAVAGNLYVSDGAAGNTNNFLIVNGSSIYATNAALTAQFRVGSSGSNNYALFNDSSLTVSGLVIVGNAGAFNLLAISNTTVASIGLTIGSGTSNTVSISNSTWNLNGGILTFSGLSNNLSLDTASVLTNIGGVSLAGAGYTLTMTNATGSRNLILGTGAVANAGLNIGVTSGQGGNTLILSNQTYASGGASTIGNGSSNNVLTMLTNTVWDSGNQTLTIGSQTVMTTGNVLVVNGGILSNVGAVNMWGVGNSLIISNGAQFYTRGEWRVGESPNGSNNLYQVGGLGARSTVSNVAPNYAVDLGPNAGANTSLGGNRMIVTNATLFTTGSVGVVLADGSSNNTIQVLSKANWNMLGSAVYIGGYNARLNASNTMTIDGGGVAGGSDGAVVTNAGAVYLGYIANSVANSLIITNGGQLYSGAVTIGNAAGASNNLYAIDGGATASIVSNGLVTVGGAGTTSNRMTVANANLMSLGLTIGGNTATTNNTVTVNSGATWNLLNSALIIGGSNNLLTLNTGGVMTNVGGITMAGKDAQLFLTNATGQGNLYLGNSNAFTIGNTAGWGGNLLVLSNQTYTSTAASTIGSSSSNNTLKILGTTMWNAGAQTLTIGSGGLATGNVLVVDGGGMANGSVVTNTAGIEVGQGASWNSLVVSNGGVMAVNAGVSVRIGDGVGGTAVYGNRLLIDNGTFTQGASGDFDIGLANLTGGGAGGSNSVSVVNGGYFSIQPGGNAGIWLGGYPGPAWGSSSNTLYVAGTNGASARATVNLNTAPLNIGTAPYASNNWAVISAGGLIVNGAVSVGGANGSGNGLLVTNGGAVSINAVTVTGGGQGNKFVLSSANSTATVASLTANAGNSVTFNGGVLNSSSTTISNSIGLTVGDGTQFANLNLAAGNHSFSNGTASGLIISSNAWLTGVGTVFASGNIILTNGAFISPGLGTNGIGAMTLNASLFGSTGTVYDISINKFLGTAGVNWDLLNVVGTLTNTSTLATNNFILRLDPQGVTGYSSFSAYSLPVATFTSALYTNNFTIDNSLVGGSWRIVTNANTLYLVQDVTLTPGFVWTNAVSGAWSSNTVWNPATVPIVGGSNTYILRFDGSTSYNATNTLGTPGGTSGNFTNAAIGFNTTASTTNVLSGATLTFANAVNGLNAGFYQQNSGAFIVSNSVLLATNIVFDGAGQGAVIFASNITGNGQITKQGGAYNTVLQGSNSFTGPVLINSDGTLTLANAYALGTNSVTISNGTIFATVAYTVGNGINNQTVLITGTGSTWTNSTLTIGNGIATGTVVTLDNGGVLAAGAVNVGNSAGSSGSGLVITNGGRVSYALTIGAVAGSTNNYLTVIGTNTPATLTGVLTLGGAGSGFNQVTITNATLFLSNTGTIGNGSSNNVATVLANGTWNMQNNNLYLGGNTATGNMLVVNGGVVTNVRNLFLGSQNVRSDFSSLIISNGGQVFVDGANVSANDSLYWGANGTLGHRVVIDNGTFSSPVGQISFGIGSAGGGGTGGGHFMSVTNGGYLSAAGLSVGNYAGGSGYGSSMNTVMVSSVNAAGTNATVNLRGGALQVGAAATASNNLFQVGSGGIVTNVAAITIGANTGTAAGSTPSFNNSLLVTNGGLLFSRSTVTIGSIANSNKAIVAGNNATWDLGGAANTITIGSGASTGNLLQVDAGGILTNGAITLGSGTVSSANNLIITNGGKFWGGLITIGGNASSSNTFSLANNNTIGSLGLTIGNGSSNNTVNVGPNVTWDLRNTALTWGSGAASNNLLTIDPTSTLSNVFGITLNDGGTTVLISNSMLNGGGRILFSGGSITIGSASTWGNSTLILSNQTLATTGPTMVGHGSSNNALRVLGGSVWNAGGAALTVGGGLAATGNTVVIEGGDCVDQHRFDCQRRLPRGRLLHHRGWNLRR